MKKLKRIVYVTATPVGNGLFARTSFQPSEVIFEVQGEVIDDPDYESDYCIDLGHDAKLEPAEPFRFINHCCEPNCELVLWKKQRIKKRRYYRVWLQALRPIDLGTELTIDYAWPAEAAIPCRCASAHCRKWIVCPDEMDLLTVSDLAN